MTRRHPWRDLALDPRDEARELLTIARNIREDRQVRGDNRDNGDAATLTEAADARRAHQHRNGDN